MSTAMMMMAAVVVTTGEKEGLNEREIHLYHAMHALTRDVCN